MDREYSLHLLVNAFLDNDYVSYNQINILFLIISTYLFMKISTSFGYKLLLFYRDLGVYTTPNIIYITYRMFIFCHGFFLMM